MSLKRKAKEEDTVDSGERKAKKQNVEITDDKVILQFLHTKHQTLTRCQQRKVARQRSMEDFVVPKDDHEKLKAEMIGLTAEERAQMIEKETDPAKKKVLKSISASIKRSQDGKIKINKTVIVHCSCH